MRSLLEKLLLLAISIGPCWIEGTAKLSFDWASFKYHIDKAQPESLSLVELYFSCPYYAFEYQVTNETIWGRYQKEIFLKNLLTEDTLKDTSSHRIILPSFETAQTRDLKVLDIFRFLAQPGQYYLSLILKDLSTPNKKFAYVETIEVPCYENHLSLSDLILASSIVRDTGASKFTKGGVKIIPNPSSEFGEAYKIIYVYLEGYNLANDTNSYLLRYRILNKDDVILKELPHETFRKTGPNFAHTFAFSAQGLPPDQHFLEVTLQDISNNNTTKKRKAFSIITFNNHLQKSLNEFNLTEYEKVFNVVASTNEQKYYQKLSSQGKIEYQKHFWRTRDFNEVKARLEYVDKHYSIGRVLGRNTDRGRIYIKYGKPDEVVIHTMIEHTKPHEHWYYYEQGLQFIFVDIRGDNNFRLIYTNSDKETKPLNWEKYIDPFELEDLQ
jgi:GWxTD domain-containing protein